MTKQFLALSTAALFALAPPLAVSAGKAADVQEQLDRMQAALQAQQAQLEVQRAQLAQQAAELAALRTQLASVANSADVGADVASLKQDSKQAQLASQESPRWTLNSGRPMITSADGRSTFAVRAITQMDMAHYEQAGASTLATDARRGSVGALPNRENNGARDLSDGIYFRRARLGFEGMIARDFNYRVVMELGGAGVEGPTRINDAWINYTGFAPLTIQLGAFAPPSNMEDGTSPEDSLFIERASSSELSRVMGGADGRMGVGVRGSGTRWMGALTLTGRTFADAEVFDSQAALVGRAGWLLTTSSDYNVHTGLSGTYVIHLADQGGDSTGARYGARFRDRPELRVDSTRLIDTGSIDAEHAYVAGIEFGANYRNLMLQTENFWFGIDRRNSTLDDPHFGGYYVESSWVMTGESHRYNMTNGSFQNPRPFVPFSTSGGLGAWELALRYSHMDLNFHEGLLGFAPSADGVRGGAQDIWAVGVNWYLNSNLKFLLNYLRVDVDRLNPLGPGNLTPFGASTASPVVGSQIGQEYDAVAIRTQLAF